MTENTLNGLTFSFLIFRRVSPACSDIRELNHVWFLGCVRFQSRSYLLVIGDFSHEDFGDFAGVSVRIVVHLPLPEEGDVCSDSDKTNRKKCEPTLCSCWTNSVKAGLLGPEEWSFMACNETVFIPHLISCFF